MSRNHQPARAGGETENIKGGENKKWSSNCTSFHWKAASSPGFPRDAANCTQTKATVQSSPVCKKGA